jgi:hypothetical protein
LGAEQEFAGSLQHGVQPFHVGWNGWARIGSKSRIEPVSRADFHGHAAYSANRPEGCKALCKRNGTPAWGPGAGV